jgi:uncharacterized protein YgiM (DUF1202 family)
VKHLTRLGGKWQLGVLAIVLLAALFAPLMAGSALAQQPTAVVINAPRVNLRSDAGAGFPVVGSVAEGEVVELLGRNKYATWAQVRTAGGLVGWISTYYLDRASGFNDIPIVAAYVAQGLVNNSPTLNVRQGPGLDYAVVGTLQFGEYVNLLGRNEDSSWLYIQKNALTGWIASAEVEATVPRYTLPVTNLTGQGGGGTVITPQQTTTQVIGTAADAGRVNTARGNDHGIITYLQTGEPVTVLARGIYGDWVYIFIRGDTLGWIETKYVNLPVDKMTLPYLSDVGSIVGEHLEQGALTLAGAYGGVTLSTSSGSGGGGTVSTSPTTTSTALVNAGALNVHSGPWWYDPVVFKVYQGQSVTLIARIPDASWVKIDANGQQGWVDADYLNIGYDIDFLPVLTSTTGY